MTPYIIRLICTLILLIPTHYINATGEVFMDEVSSEIIDTEVTSQQDSIESETLQEEAIQDTIETTENTNESEVVEEISTQEENAKNDTTQSVIEEVNTSVSVSGSSSTASGAVPTLVSVSTVGSGLVGTGTFITTREVLVSKGIVGSGGTQELQDVILEKNPTLEERLEQVREENKGLCKKTSVNCIEKVLDDNETIEVTITEDDESGSYYDESTGTLYEYDKKPKVKKPIDLPEQVGSGTIAAPLGSGGVLTEYVLSGSVGSGSGSFSITGTGVTFTGTSTTSGWTDLYNNSVSTTPEDVLITGAILSGISQPATTTLLIGSTGTGVITLSRYVHQSMETLLMTPAEGTIDENSIKVDFTIDQSKALKLDTQKKLSFSPKHKDDKIGKSKNTSIKRDSFQSRSTQVTNNRLDTNSTEITLIEISLNQDTYILADETDQPINESDIILDTYDASNDKRNSLIGGFSFGAQTHLLFSDPVLVELTTSLPDGEIAEILVKHTGESEFGTFGIGVDPIALCRNDGSITSPGNKIASENGMIRFYTCGASEFVVIQNIPGSGTPLPNPGPEIKSFSGSTSASIQVDEGTLAITGFSATDTGIIGEFGSIDLLGDSRSTLSYQYEYCDPIVVTTPHYQTATDATSTDQQRERNTRINNLSGTGFDIKVDNDDQSLIPSLVSPVHYIIMERGAHSLDDGSGGSLAMEAGRVENNNTIFSRSCQNFDAADVFFSTGFTGPPAVFHSLSSFNDSDNAYSFVNGGSRENEPTQTFMNIGVSIGNDGVNCAHGAEDTDWIAFDEGSINAGGFEADFTISPDNVDCCNNNPVNFGTPFTNPPQTLLTAQLGEDGGDGGYSVVRSDFSTTTTQASISIDEGGSIADRGHTTEIVSLASFSSSSGVFYGASGSEILNRSIGGGADGSLFTIDSAGELSFNAPQNFDTPNDANGDNIYEVIVQVNDEYSCTAADTQTLFIEILDLPPAVCGNGIIESQSEQCDDSNSAPGDGCSDTCQIEEDYTCVGEPSSCIFCQAGDLIRSTVVSNLGNSSQTISFSDFTSHTYSFTPLVFLTPTTDRNTNNYSIPRVESVTLTGVTLSSCVDAGAQTCTLGSNDDDFSLFVVDVGSAACLDHVQVGTITIDTDGSDTAFSFSTGFTNTPYVFTTPQTANQGSNIAAHAWVDDGSLTVNGGDFVGCVHQAPGDGTSIDNCTTGQPTETLGWIAFDPVLFSYTGLQFGAESIAQSTWTPISYAAYTNNPAIMVTQNSDNGGQDPQYAWARNTTTTTAEIRYCEADAGGVCNTHTNEDVMWFSYSVAGCGDGEIAGTEECDDNNITSGDGCSDTCTIESGYSCIGEPSMCSLLNSDPTDITLSGNTLIENNTIGQLIGTLSTTDLDLGDTHSYSFSCTVPLPDESFFSFSGNQLLAGTGFNFEIPSDTNSDNIYDICILTDDANGGTYEENFTISVLDEYEEICIYVGSGVVYDPIPVSNNGNIVASQTLTGRFQLEDLNGSNTGYYTTLQIGGFNGLLGNFMPATIAEISNTNPITVVSGSANPNVVLDPTLSSFIPFDTPITYLSRNTGTNNGVTGYYSTSPTLRLTIPEYQAVDTYTATITYTLYEN